MSNQFDDPDGRILVFATRSGRIRSGPSPPRRRADGPPTSGSITAPLARLAHVALVSGVLLAGAYA
jgi:hypothetical protein